MHTPQPPLLTVVSVSLPEETEWMRRPMMLLHSASVVTMPSSTSSLHPSHYIIMIEPINGGQDLHVSITMPSIEVGTVGGGTQLASLSQLV
ncbi:hypothetical protein ACFX1R_027182 [Malus domestica]